MSVQYCACQQGYFCVVYKFSRVTFYFLHVNPKECVGNIRKFVIEISLYIPAYFWGSIEALKCQSCKLLNNRHIHTPPEVVHLCMPLVFIINNLKVLYSYNLIKNTMDSCYKTHGSIPKKLFKSIQGALLALQEAGYSRKKSQP